MLVGKVLLRITKGQNLVWPGTQDPTLQGKYRKGDDCNNIIERKKRLRITFCLRYIASYFALILVLAAAGFSNAMYMKKLFFHSLLLLFHSFLLFSCFILQQVSNKSYKNNISNRHSCSPFFSHRPFDVAASKISAWGGVDSKILGRCIY